MPGLYPDNQTLSLFGEELVWPGVDPVTGKFTNGSFSDPLTKPSFVPADTLNLLLDNVGNLLSYLGFDPNNTDPEQLKKAFHGRRPIGDLRLVGFDATPLQLAMRRYLPLTGQLIEIALYQDLCDLKYCGNDNNATAEWWYKCDAQGTRTITGTYMRVLDHQGIGIVGAGSQQRVIYWQDSDGVWHNCKTSGGQPTPPTLDDVGQTGADGKPIVATLYDGKEIGEFSGDTIREIIGRLSTGPNAATIMAADNGAFKNIDNTRIYLATGGVGSGYPSYVDFIASYVVPTGPYNQGPVTAAQICMTY
jgi:hypothetical protein